MTTPLQQAAYDIGAKGSDPTEEERLAFESWMRGHCWAVIGDWDGKQYKHGCEDGEFIHGGAMGTRRLWAAWRDRGAVARVLAEQAQAVEPIGYIRHADKTFWPHPECAVYASVSPSLAPVYAHPAPPLAGERAELIADLRLNHEYCPKEVILEAADMLEADAQELQATERQVEILSDDLSKCSKAQKVAVPDKREPLTFDQIDALENRVYMQTTHKGRPMFEYVNAIIRAVEAHHGITGAKP